MKPIGKYIIIKRIDEEVFTDAGLLLSQDEARSRRYQKGEIVKVGTEVNGIKSLDVIYYDQRQSHTMVIEGKQYTVIQERDIVVVL